MPQLDKITFMSQILWLLPISLFIYSFLLSRILPQIALTLKLRQRLLSDLSTSTTSLNQEGFQLLASKEKHGYNILQLMNNTLYNLKNGNQFNETIKILNPTLGQEFEEINRIMFQKLVSLHLISTLIEKHD